MTVIHKEFMCVHGEGGQERCDDTYARAMAYMNKGSEEIRGGWVTDKSFLTGIVTFLNWDFHINITHIHTDMWSVVGAEMVSYEDSKREVLISYHIQCDEVEHALAYLLVDAPKKLEDVQEDQP